MATLDDILATLRADMGALRQEYGVRSLQVFGSYVRGEQRAHSDLDILVEFERTPTFFEFVRLERRLSQRMGVKVDLVMRTALKPTIGRYILAEAVPV